MQFTWKYIDDLMGKGLDTFILMELLFYVSASLIPLALPLAILLSSIMTFGNLAENNELTALKSSGLSLFKIMRPLTFVAALISLGTFFFSNYIIPVANLKWHSLIYDIQETKVSILLTPGSYSKEIEGYAIKADKGKNNTFIGLTIHDYTTPNIVKTIKADSATVFKAAKGNYLFFQLKNGKVMEELNAEPPIFTNKGDAFHAKNGEFRPQRRTEFAVATYKMNLVGFNLNRSDEDLFKDDYEMLNVFQIQYANDSLQQFFNKQNKTFVDARKSERPYFLSRIYKAPKLDSSIKTGMTNVTIPAKILTKDSFSFEEKKAIYSFASSSLRSLNANLGTQKEIIKSVENSIDLFRIEFHRKFALSAAVFILFFIGAPLGAIVRKGGFGAPVVIASLLFMVYFVLFSFGQGMAEKGVVSPFWGMWMPSVVLAPIAVLLMIAASNDLGVFDRKLWRLIFSLGRKR